LLKSKNLQFIFGALLFFFSKVLWEENFRFSSVAIAFCVMLPLYNSVGDNAGKHKKIKILICISFIFVFFTEIYLKHIGVIR
jgi:hypothetical protein